MRVKVEISTKDRYVSICGEVYRKHARKPWRMGQCVDEIKEAFPELKPFMWLHLCDIDTGLPCHAEANSLYWFLNDKPEFSKEMLHLSEEETEKLYSLCRFGIHHRVIHSEFMEDWTTCGEDGQKTYHNAFAALHIPNRVINAYKDFIGVVNQL